MGTVIIVMPKPEVASQIAMIVRRSGSDHTVEICQNGQDALRIARDRDYGVIIAPKQLRDMSHVDLEEYLPTYFGLIILTSDMTLETYGENVVKLSMPLKAGDLTDTIEMMTNGFYRIIRKKRKDRPAPRSEDEKQLITKAKELLMERNGLTEPEAFRYIQKASMDSGRTMVESAEMILLMSK